MAFTLRTATQVVEYDLSGKAFGLVPALTTPPTSCLAYWRVEDIVDKPDWMLGAAGPEQALGAPALDTWGKATPTVDGTHMPLFFRIVFTATGEYLAVTSLEDVEKEVTKALSKGAKQPAPSSPTAIDILGLTPTRSDGTVFTLMSTYRAVLQAHNTKSAGPNVTGSGSEGKAVLTGASPNALVAIVNGDVRMANPVQAWTLCTNMKIRNVTYGLLNPGTLGPGCGSKTILWGTCACEVGVALGQQTSVPWYQMCDNQVAFGFWVPNLKAAVKAKVTDPVPVVCAEANMLQLAPVDGGVTCTMPPPSSDSAGGKLTSPAPALAQAAAAEVAALSAYKTTATWVAVGVGALLLLAIAGMLVHASLEHRHTLRLLRTAAKIEGGGGVAARRVQTAKMAARAAATKGGHA